MKPKSAKQTLSSNGPWRTKIDSRGWITIPKPIRDEFGLRAKDVCTFTRSGDESVSFRIFRELKTGRLLDLIKRKVVRRLPGWHDHPSTQISPMLEFSRQAVLSAATDAGASIQQRVDDSVSATTWFDRVPGEILRNDFVRPFGLSAKKIARSVHRDRKEAAAFAKRLDDFMAHAEWGFDLPDCLMLDRFFGLGDGYFWRVIGACEVRAGVIEHVGHLAQIKPLQQVKMATEPNPDRFVQPPLLTQTQARQLLPTLIGRLSLDLHDRSWLSSVPFTLWESVIGQPTEPFDDEDVALFRHLSAVAGGWAHYDEQEGRQFVARAVWMKEFDRWKARQSAPDPERMKEWDRSRVRMRRMAKKTRSKPLTP